MPLLDNPVTVIESHPDVAHEGVGLHRLPGSEHRGDGAHRMIVASMSDYEMAGILSKRNDVEGRRCNDEDGGSFRTAAPDGSSGRASAVKRRVSAGVQQGLSAIKETAIEMKDAVVGEWRDRFFVLHGGR